MECNKEEAIRAKSIAESRMQNKDFEGARKIALKAQSLFPDLESISQILAVCDVHCASATNLVGGTDWYGILQVEMTADETTIRKQYRKLALLLHPDKNKLAGAEGAFQQVGDAYKILSDPAKRSQHDMVRRGNFRGVSLNQAVRRSYRPSTKKQPGPGVSNTAAKSTFSHVSGLNQDKPSSFSCPGVFWTICPSCHLKFQYQDNVLNNEVRCKKCFNRFVAYDFKAGGEPATENLKKDGNSAPLTDTKTDSFDAFNMEFQKSNAVDSSFNQGTKLERTPKRFGEPNDILRDCKVEDDTNNCNDIKFQKVQLHSVHDAEKPVKPPARQRKSISEVKQNAETSADRTDLLRRSNRHKQNVIPDEVQDACMDSQPPASKRSRQGAKQVDTVQINNGNSHIHSEFNESLSPRCKTSVDTEKLSNPVPELSKFEAERCESKFAIDQIWALYDDIDGMPRSYARVRKVYSRGFKLQLSWLEKDPRTIAEMKWSEQGLPVSCGSYKLGKSFSTEQRQIFSHLVPWRKGLRRNSYMIYPRRGEIWALFSNWDIRWSSEPDNQRVHKYQVVEVVSDFREVKGISVIRLTKVKEFMALFVRTADAEESLLEIPEKDVLMFSHRIPACRMTGKEEDGIPDGAFELDCASLPTNFGANVTSISTKVVKSRTLNDGSVSDNVRFNSTPEENKISQSKMEKLRSGSKNFPSKKMNGISESHKNEESERMTLINDEVTEADKVCSQNPDTEHNTSPTSSLSFEYPESEFYDFESDRLMEKFVCGQVWAFYCEIDGFPKYYGRIRVVDRETNQVQVRWLGATSASDQNGHCPDDKPPPACGTFRTTKEGTIMDSVASFSHLVKANPTAKNHYNIFPDVGEVWAVYRNWNASWCADDLKNSEFDIVEISDCVASGIKALLLTKVDGHVSVFRRESEGHDLAKLIPFSDRLKFSHRIPAYRLTKGMGSSYWELDPAAVPTIFLTSKP